MTTGRVLFAFAAFVVFAAAGALMARSAWADLRRVRERGGERQIFDGSPVRGLVIAAVAAAIALWAPFVILAGDS